MDNAFFRPTFRLPLSPTEYSVIHYAGPYENQQLISHTPYLTSNMVEMPLLLATPPLSPNEQQLPPMDMPAVRALLSNNHTEQTPTGYVVHIPCFLCQQPFSDINSLREHLTMHASQLNMVNEGGTEVLLPPHAHVAQRAPHYAHIPQQTPPYAHVPQQAPPYNHVRLPQEPPPPVHVPLTPPAHVVPPPPPVEYICTPPSTAASSPESTEFSCDLCGLALRSKGCLYIHQKMQHNLPEQHKKKCYSKPFRCHLCKKNYRREVNLAKHMQVRHRRQSSVSATSAILNELLADQPTQITPPSSVDGDVSSSSSNSSKDRERGTNTTTTTSSSKSRKRVIWSTKLLNAVAAANYSPAKESASKYKSPTEEVTQTLLTKPKQKYALRSPFCNPNLWVDYDNHVP